jgi:hypothetical protein
VVKHFLLVFALLAAAISMSKATPRELISESVTDLRQYPEFTVYLYGSETNVDETIPFSVTLYYQRQLVDDQWQHRLLVAETRDNQYVRTLVADGEQVWDYRVPENVYTVTPYQAIEGGSLHSMLSILRLRGDGPTDFLADYLRDALMADESTLFNQWTPWLATASVSEDPMGRYVQAIRPSRNEALYYYVEQDKDLGPVLPMDPDLYDTTAIPFAAHSVTTQRRGQPTTIAWEALVSPGIPNGMVFGFAPPEGAVAQPLRTGAGGGN